MLQNTQKSSLYTYYSQWPIKKSVIIRPKTGARFKLLLKTLRALAATLALPKLPVKLHTNGTLMRRFFGNEKDDAIVISCVSPEGKKGHNTCTQREHTHTAQLRDTIPLTIKTNYSSVELPRSAFDGLVLSRALVTEFVYRVDPSLSVPGR